jgi:plasmid stability protein
MANLTIAVDDDLLKRARLRAVEQGTSVNALVRGYLEDYVGSRERQREAVKRLLAAARKSTAGSGGRKWKREDLYDRPVFRRK